MTSESENPVATSFHTMQANATAATAPPVSVDDHTHHVLLDWRLVLLYLTIGIAALLMT